MRFSMASCCAPAVAVWSLAVGLAAAQALQQADEAALGAVHLEAAKLGELDDLSGRHEGDHGVAVFAPCQKSRHHGLDMLFDEQHVDDDDVALGDILSMQASSEEGCDAQLDAA